MLRTLASGAPACVAVTLLDGLVLARSAFHHSMNYRSVVLFGAGRPVTDNAEKAQALEAIVEHIVPGRWKDARRPVATELMQTLVVQFPITEASAKVRTGPPIDNEDDYALDVWAGVIPMKLAPGEPLADGHLNRPRDVPSYVSNYERPSPRG
jgi:nitroimidazol reductase NimA-like FMN-containing flavoprotein (pyridoxamine 5'-phosphate oxidase superfamily)